MLRSALLVLLVACGPKATAPSTPVNSDPSTPAQTSPLGPDGKHVAAERVYEGRCAPAGSRGGCVTITLRPDGTYRNFLYDAAIDGTYTIVDHTLTLNGPSGNETMTFSADWEKLDDLALKR
jgi:hypothetical protein